MEENNNNLKQSLNKFKEKLSDGVEKQANKKVKNKLLRKIVIMVLPYFIIFLLCLLAIGVIMATAFSIINIFSGLLGIDASSPNLSDTAQKIVSITDSGYKINDDYSKQILEQLEEQHVDVSTLGFTTEETEDSESSNNESMEDMIGKYIKAEVATLYPDLGLAGDVQGLVKIQRMDTKGKVTPLIYKEYEEFCNLVNSGKEDPLIYFSLNPDNFKLCYAVSQTIKYYDYDENYPDNKKEIVDAEETIYTIQEQEYQTYLYNYATPLNYFIAMHLISADQNFMEEILEEVLKSDIVLTIIETYTQENTKIDYDGTLTKKYYKMEPIYDITWEESLETGQIQEVIDYENPVEDSSETIIVNNNNANHYVSTQRYFTENIKRTGKLYITKANTWILKSEQKIEILRQEQETPDSNRNPIEPEVNIKSNETTRLDDSKTYNQTRGTIYETITEWEIETKETTVEMGSGYDITFLIGLIQKDEYAKVKNNLETAPSMLFYLLEQNANTTRLASIMKYVIFSLTGNSYGVTDLSIFNLNSFIGIEGNVSIDELIGTEEYENANETQRKIVAVAMNSTAYGIIPKEGYCLAWVNDVYQVAGAAHSRTCCANCSGYKYGVSKDFSQIPLGAAVYGLAYTSGGTINQYGHIAIYIGNGMVADNIGSVRISKLSDWIQKYPSGCWGWTSNTSITGAGPIQGLIPKTHK